MRCRVNSSPALRVTVSSSARLSPRCGTRICTREPRRWHSHSSYVATSSGSYGTSTCFGTPVGGSSPYSDSRMRSTSPPGRELLDLVEHEALASDHAALAHVEHLHRRLEIVVGDADHVDVLVLVGDHLLLGDRLLHGDQTVAQARRTLELELGGGALHLRLEPMDDLVGVAGEEVAQLADELAVRHLLDLADARAGALLDVEEQARPPEPLMLVELGRAARADREAPQQQVERVADRVRVRVRAEVARALALAAAHDQRPRPLLVDRHGEERVRLVVAQPDVEPRLVLLDQRVLEHQRLDLVADGRPLDGLGGLDHLARPRVQIDAAPGSSWTGAGADWRPCRRRSPAPGRP